MPCGVVLVNVLLFGELDGVDCDSQEQRARGRCKSEPAVKARELIK